MSAQAYSTELSSRRARARAGPGFPLGVACLCALALALVWVLAALVPATHFKDAVALQDFTLLSRPGVDSLAGFMLRLINPLLFVLWGLALVAFVLAQGRPRVAVAIVAVMSLAPISAGVLKPLLAHPHAQIGSIVPSAASWPSGHSTAALALVLCAVLAAPPRWRPLVGAIGAIYAVAVGVSLLILAWHMPSDVLGGFLLASLWMALAVAALRAAERRWPTTAAR
jgi:membrane-associated phospholipid phosphatase